MCMWKGPLGDYVLSELVCNTRLVVERIESLGNYDDNYVKKKKTIGFMSKTKALHVHHAF